MDLNKKLEELKPYQLNCNVFDVYSYNGLTMQDLLCQFFTKINECITVSNETIDLAKWLVNEGLEIEVVKKLMIWLEDGTLENIINVNLFNTLNEKINGLSSQLEHIENEFKYTIHLQSNNDLTTDDINNAIALLGCGGTLYLTGTFSLGLNLVALKSNISIVGRNNAVIQGNDWLMCANYNIVSACEIIKNIYINNITFKHLDGVFLENVGQCLLSNTENVKISKCNFIGSKSDGIAIGGDILGNIGTNKNIIVRDCYFDGVNNQNRNAITISAVDGCVVENNTFKNFTKSTMPGAIDIETDERNGWIVKNILINNNKFYNIGGCVGVISLLSFCSQEDLLEIIENIKITNNFIDTTKDYQSGIVVAQVGETQLSNTTPLIDVMIEGNTIINSNYRGFNIEGVRGCNIENNTFINCKQGNLIGNLANKTHCKDIKVQNNVFERCGTNEGVGLIVSNNIERIKISNNNFVDCGKIDKSLGNAVAFWKHSSSDFISKYIDIHNNTVSSPNCVNTIAFSMDSNFSTDENTNKFYNNDMIGVTGNTFKYKIDYPYVGNRYYDPASKPDSIPLGVNYCTCFDTFDDAPSGVQYGTLLSINTFNTSALRATIKQYFYDGVVENGYNVYFRTADYSTNTWKPWKKIMFE